MAGYVIVGLLEKMTNNDSDIRFMAGNDLYQELSKDTIVLDEPLERKIVSSLLKLLSDSNGEVQNMAVKVLMPLSKRIRESQLTALLEELCKWLSSSQEQSRDIAALGLKTIVLELSPSASFAVTAVTHLVPRLLSQLEKPSAESSIDVIDLLIDILNKFGHKVLLETKAGLPLQQSLLNTLFPLLDHSRASVRKRSASALGNVSLYLTDDNFDSLAQHLVTQADKKRKDKDYEKLQTLISCMTTLSRFGPARLSNSAGVMLNLFLECSALEDDDLIETCIQAIETFVIRLPNAVAARVNDVTDLGLKYIKYDPNYNYDEDDEMETDDDEFDGDEEDDEDVYSDDEDVSWKVRRAASKLLSSLIESRPDLLLDFYTKLGAPLISQFKDREESVRVDIVSSFGMLVKQTSRGIGSSNVSVIQNASPERNAKRRKNRRGSKSPSVVPMEDDSSPIPILKQLLPKLMQVVFKVLNEKSIPTRLACFQLLKDIVIVLEGELTPFLPALIPAVEKSLSAASASQFSKASTFTSFKLQVLEFASNVIALHSSIDIQPYWPQLLKTAQGTCDDKFYKVSAAGFGVLSELVKNIRPYIDENGKTTVAPLSEEAAQLSQQVYFSVKSKLDSNDIDSEVREAAIVVLGDLVARLGDALGADLLAAELLPFIFNLLQNEVTRLYTVKVILSIAESPLVLSQSLGGPFSKELPAFAKELGLLLKKAHRQVRISSLMALDALITQLGSDLPSQVYSDFLPDVFSIILSDADLYMLPFAFGLILAILRTNKDGNFTAKTIKQLTPALTELIVRTPHVVSGGPSLEALLQTWRTIASLGGSAIASEALQLLLSKTSEISDASGRDSFTLIAKSIGAISHAAPSTLAPDLIKRFSSSVANAKKQDNDLLLSLLALGEIGIDIDVFEIDSNVHQVIQNLFSSSSEEVKTAAALSLGKIALGNLKQHIPFIMDSVQSGQKEYLSLLALKELVSRASTSPAKKEALSLYAKDIWTILLSKSLDGLEEGTRNTIAECLGQLATSDPKVFLSELRGQLSSPKAEIRSTILSALRFTFSAAESENQRVYDSLLAPLVIEFLKLVQDPDVNVRKVTLMALNSAAHSKPHLIQSSLSELMPLLYQQTFVREDLIRIVEMGPFKHKVDGGLDCRKAAYESMHTILHSFEGQIEPHAFLDRVVAGLSDTSQDIQTLSHLMLQRLVHIAPSIVLAKLNDISDILKTHIQTKPKTNAVKQEVERIRELVRSCVKSTYVLNDLADVSSQPKFVELWKACEDPNSLAREYLDTLKQDAKRNGIKLL